MSPIAALVWALLALTPFWCLLGFIATSITPSSLVIGLCVVGWIASVLLLGSIVRGR